jgi:Novel STAND NTPase 1
LTRDQRRQAIEGPLGGTRIACALVERILNDAGDEPDQLPILQHVLMRTWSRWREESGNSARPIEAEDYEAVGGFSDALNQHANDLLNTEAARAEPEVPAIVFKRLTAIGRSNRERRDPAPLWELWALCHAGSEEERKRVNAVIDVFRTGEATFLTPRGGALKEDTNIDITHESLIRNWKILANIWLPAEERQAKALIELLDRARGWRSGDRALLVGLDLAGAREWDRIRNHSPRWAEHYIGRGAIEEVEQFLAASRAEFEKSERRKEEQRDRELAAEQQLREAAEQRAQVEQHLREAAQQAAQAERDSSRRTRIFSYVLACLLMAALAFAALAWRATIRARDQQKLAESRELAAKAEALLSLGRRGEALNSAIGAFTIASTSEAREAIAHSHQRLRRAKRLHTHLHRS